MKYQVVITEPAEVQLIETFEWWSSNRSKEQAIRWYNGFLDAMKTLSDSPVSHPIIPEAGKFPIELRELYFGLGSRPSHRAVYSIQPDRIVIYAIRHLAQDQLGTEDLIP